MSQEVTDNPVEENGETDELVDDYSLDPDNITRFVILANDTDSNDKYSVVQEKYATENGDEETMEYIEEAYEEESNPNIKFEVIDDYEDSNIVDDSLMDKYILVQDAEDYVIDESDNVKLECLSNENSNEAMSGDQDENEDESEKLYACSTCNISFTDIVEHIQKYHEDQEVMVQMINEEEEILEDGNPRIDNELDETSQQSDNEDNLQALIQYDVQEVVTDEPNHNKELSKNKTWKMPQMLNTLQEEECTDKDGRLYTRKVVQIEKFWDKALDEENEIRILKTRAPSPILYQYIETEDGTILEFDPQDSDLNIKLEPGNQIKSVYHCSRCLVQCADLSEFKTHTCQTDDMYKCDTCSVHFKTQALLASHMKMHKTVKSNLMNKAAGGPYMCFECDTVFPSNKSLRLHRRMHGPIKQKHIEQFYGAAGPEAMDDLPEGELGQPREQFKCQVCNKSYDKAFEKIHMSVHSGELQYNCHICNRKFFTESNLSMHMRVHTIEKPQVKKQKGDLPYVCGFCDRQFARPHEKVKHERIHTGEKPHECEICGKRFRVSYCLTLHMRTHTGARPYECPHCHKRFKAHSVYNHHLMTHSDVRAYKCPYCPKAFKTAVQLAGHKNSHTKPFSCTECNRPFASLYAVRGHMEIHKKQNSLKYKCSMCGASYARGFALRDHMKEQHHSTVVSEDDGVVIDESLLDTHLLPEGDTIEIPIEEYHYDGTEISGAYIKIEGPIEYEEQDEEL